MLAQVPSCNLLQQTSQPWHALCWARQTCPQTLRVWGACQWPQAQLAPALHTHLAGAAAGSPSLAAAGQRKGSAGRCASTAKSVPEPGADVATSKVATSVGTAAAAPRPPQHDAGAGPSNGVATVGAARHAADAAQGVAGPSGAPGAAHEAEEAVAAPPSPARSLSLEQGAGDAMRPLARSGSVARKPKSDVSKAHTNKADVTPWVDVAGVGHAAGLTGSFLVKAKLVRPAFAAKWCSILCV